MKSKTSVDNALGLPSLKEWSNMTGEEYDENEDDSTEMDLYQDDEEDIEDDESFDIKRAREAMQKLKEMRVQLKDLPDITHRKSHLDKLALLAEKKFEDIFDRAFNCEDRFASEMINAANAMLKIALDAHSKIIESDIKLVDMQIKKDKMEIELNLKPKNGNGQNSADGSIEGETVQPKTRNEMLAMRKQNK